jgi:putative ABC transport system permease protein
VSARSLRQVLGLAWREGRTVRRRLLLYMSSIALGTGALVAIDSFSANVAASVHESSRALLGGDLAFNGRSPLRGAAAQLIDSLGRAGARSARVTTFPSMASVRRTGRTRLAQVRAVSDPYPLVGHIETDPATAWSLLAGGPRAVVDPALLATLDARIGDSLTLGYARFAIVGTIRTVPGDAGLSAAIGPRVFIPERDLNDTRLLVFGSRADYRTLVALPGRAPAASARWIRQLRPRLDRERVRVQTSADAETNLTNAIQRLTDFLSIIGVMALLLGGIGVASGVAAFVARKIDAAAILRCLGATESQVLVMYVSQAAVMGLIGATVGAAIGVGIQFALPTAARGLLPVDLTVALVPRAIARGLFVGCWVSLLFALRPLLALRRVPPLQALRRDVDTLSAPDARRAGRDPAAAVVAGLIAATVVVIAASRAPSLRIGLGTAAGIIGAVVILWLTAMLLAAVARRVVRPQWPYVLRQGVANLHRPANQTRAVVIALGAGAFLIATLYLVQSALLHEFSSSVSASRANLLFFDVQQDQVHGVDSAIERAGYQIIERTPIVTMRITAINGVQPTAASPDTTDTADADAARSGRSSRSGRGAGGRPQRAQWALRREYRSTYRDTLVGSERLVAGHWPPPHTAGDTVAGVSFEDGVARELGIGVGDVVTWDVQGVPVQTRVTSLRAVDWGRFEPNFFAVFPSGVLERAPQQAVILANVPSAAATATLQRDIVDRYPNVSTIDLSLIRETVNGVLNKVTVAIRFLGLFALVMGFPVLISAVAATRRERVREGVLLKTLGATRAQVGRIMVAEYLVLGVLASLAGIGLSVPAAWSLVHFTFDSPFVPTIAPLLLLGTLTAGLTVAIGAAGSRDVFAETPLVMLRAE